MRFTSRAKSKIRSWNIGRTSRNQKFADATAAKHPTQSVAKCRGVSHTPSTWAKTKPTHNPIKQRIQSNRCRGVSHTPSRGRKRNQCANQQSIVFNRTGVGAYRIRPHVSENETNTQTMPPPSNVLFPCHGGRMRYAPTPVRLFHR